MWAYNSVFYQIYPLGFCGAPKENDGVTVPRIRKVMEWSDYLQELGIDAVLFNPIFESDRHGYDTRDYSKIDCRLGTNADFADVCADLHKKGIRVVLDGVFNHVGRGFFGFQDVIRNREQSPYRDWFQIDFGGNSNYNDGFWYEGWEGHYELVKLNLRNPAAADYLLERVGQWIDEFDIDGIRLDVAYLVDREFMRRLRCFCQERKPEIVLIGEVLFGDYNQIVNDEMLHSCTNYECYKGLYSSFNSMNLFEIAHSLQRQYGSEPWCLYRGKHLLSFVDNHDVSRVASILTDQNHLKPIYALLFSMPGIPCLYYGSEWGALGDKSQGDDALRPCFEKPTPNALTDYIREWIRLYHNTPALQMGDYKNVKIGNKQLLLERTYEGKSVRVAVNAENVPCEFEGIALQPYEVKVLE